MFILAIDTSTKFGSVALVNDRSLIAEVQLGVELTHSETLVTTIDWILSSADHNRESIDLVACAIGPGSFTGLRIGLATAKGLALGLCKPLIGISSLLALASGFSYYPGVVVPAIDAKRDEVYAAAYKLGKVVLCEDVLPPESLCKKLEGFSENLLFISDGFSRYESVFRKKLGERVLGSAGDSRFPHASNLAFLAGDRFLKGEIDDAAKLVPNYLRHPDAALKKGG